MCAKSLIFIWRGAGEAESSDDDEVDCAGDDAEAEELEAGELWRVSAGARP